AERERLGSRTFDDGYALGRDRRFALAGGGRRLEVRFGANFPFGQIFAPPGSRFVAIEPMTAPTNALVTGSCPVVRPGQRFPAAIVDRVLDQLTPLLDDGDIVIDGGNSYYRDDIARAKSLRERGLHYVDVGTSGGVFGLERGFCLMIGGEDGTVQHLDPVFK